jgi:hypothetical protein
MANPKKIGNDFIQKVLPINEAGEVADGGAPRISDAFGFPISTDAFGRVRVSEPYTVFDNSLTNSASDVLFWSELKSGTASGFYNQNNAEFEMQVAAENDFYCRSTKMRFKYQPKKSHDIAITGLFRSEPGVLKRAGYFDLDNIGLETITDMPQNGVFFENNSGILSWNIAKNGTITETALQSDWNFDKLDGTGVSGITLDMNSTQILGIDLEWLGVGSVLVGVFIDRKFVPCHMFNHANSGFVSVYMRTANLPVTYTIKSTGGAGTMCQICCAVSSEGGFNPIGVLRSVDNGAVGVPIANGATEILVGIRLKEDSFEFSVLPIFISMIASTTANARFFLSVNPNYNGAVTWVDLPNSSVQYAINNNNLVTAEGIVINSGYISQNNDSLNFEIETALRIGKSLTGVLDELWLCGTSLGQNETFFGAIQFKDNI